MVKRWEINDNDQVFFKRETEKGTLRYVKPHGAWTVNLNEIPMQKLVMSQNYDIVFITEKYVYRINVRKALNDRHEGRQIGWEDRRGKEPKFIIRKECFDKSPIQEGRTAEQ